MRKIVLSIFIVVMAFISCSDDPISQSDVSSEQNNYSGRPNNSDKPDIHTPIVLGEKLENPYKVENMQKAFDYYNDVVSNSPLEGKKIEATHYYIQINPNTLEQLEMLDNLDNSDDENVPILHDYPLDYEILQEGDYYAYPTDENDIFHSAYTLISVDYQFTISVPYVILDEIYEPMEEEYDVETVAIFFAGLKEDLEADGIFIKEQTLPQYLINLLEEPEENPNTGNRLFGKRYRPHGCIKIENTDNDDGYMVFKETNTGVMEPLQQAKISIGKSVFWRYTYTDDNGCFTSPKKYRGKVRIRAKWRGYTATIRKTWNEVLGLWVSDHLMTITRGNNGMIKNIMHNEPHTGIGGIDLKGGHLWFKGTVHNGLRKYIDFSNANGIYHTISSANVWVWAKGKDSSAPMLHKYKQLAYMSSIANIGQANFWHVLLNGIIGNSIALVPAHLRPDLIFGGLNNKKAANGSRTNTVRIHQVVFHESAHYSHASKTGSWYWVQVFASEISNKILHGDPYSDGTKPSLTVGKKIALAEGWAVFCEFKITSAIYGKTYFGEYYLSVSNSFGIDEVNSYMNNFNVFDVPMTVYSSGNRHWFAHGVIWDTLDDTTNNSESKRRTGNGMFVINTIIDNCYLRNSSNPNNLYPIFNQLNSSINSPTALKNALKNAYQGKQEKIEELFSSYGY